MWCAAGITALEVVDQLPHAALSYSALLRAVMAGPAPRLQGDQWSPDMHAFISRCLVKEPQGTVPGLILGVDMLFFGDFAQRPPVRQFSVEAQGPLLRGAVQLARTRVCADPLSFLCFLAERATVTELLQHPFIVKGLMPEVHVCCC